MLGIVMPSALAVLRFMMSSTLVACCTGRSAGLSPFRTRPVEMPAKRYASVLIRNLPSLQQWRTAETDRLWAWHAGVLLGRRGVRFGQRSARLKRRPFHLPVFERLLQKLPKADKVKKKQR